MGTGSRMAEGRHEGAYEESSHAGLAGVMYLIWAF